MGFGKDGKGVILRESRTQALGGLANNSGVIIGTATAILERFRMLKAELTCTVSGITSGESTGLLLYLADGDLSLAEVEAAILADGPVGPNDRVTEAIVERPTWMAGVNDHLVGDEGIFTNEMGGHLLVIKPRWTFARTKGWNWIIFNQGSTVTTGITVAIIDKLFGVWVT